MGSTTVSTRNGSAPTAASSWFSVSGGEHVVLEEAEEAQVGHHAGRDGQLALGRASRPGRVMTLPQMKSITVVNIIRQTNHGSHQP